MKNAKHEFCNLKASCEFCVGNSPSPYPYHWNPTKSLLNINQLINHFQHGLSELLKSVIFLSCHKPSKHLSENVLALKVRLEIHGSVFLMVIFQFWPTLFSNLHDLKQSWNSKVEPECGIKAILADQQTWGHNLRLKS